MAGQHSRAPAEADVYDAIEAAIGESARGRWFLAEHVRRQRGAETERLLAAIARLEGTIGAERDSAREGDRLGWVRDDLSDMAEAIAHTRSEIAAHRPPVSEALDTLVHGTEQATSEILAASEAVQEAAWTLRESGTDARICDDLDRRTTAIYAACATQDVAAQRIGLVVRTLCDLEGRIAAMRARCEPKEAMALGAVTPAASPFEDPEAAGSEAATSVMPEAGPAACAQTPEPEAGEIPPEDGEGGPATNAAAAAASEFAPALPLAAPQADPKGEDPFSAAFGDLDRLSIEEKIALFQ